MPLTNAQTEAVEQAWEALREHFENAVLLLDTENRVGTDRVFEMRWHGGVTAAIGLCERGRMRIGKHATECDPDEEG